MFKKLIKSIITASVICMSMAMPVSATELPEMEQQEVVAFDPAQPVDIVINLEDESRYMGVTVYRIGDYDGERFTYLPEVLSLLDKDYFRLSRDAEKIEDAQILSGLMSEELGLEEYQVSVKEGIGTVEDLTSGLYLIVQNKADHNANLDTPYIIEAPQWSEETMEYMYDVRFFPEWEREVWFTFRNEIVYPVGLTILCIILIAYCLMGMRILKPTFTVCAFLVCGYVGMIHAGARLDIEADFLWMFVLFMSFAFIGIGVIWCLFTALSAIFRKAHITNAIKKNMFWISAFTGAAGLFYILHKYILIGTVKCAIVACTLGILGCVYQFLKKGKEGHAYTYDDLYRIEIREESDDERL